MKWAVASWNSSSKHIWGRKNAQQKPWSCARSCEGTWGVGLNYSKKAWSSGRKQQDRAGAAQLPQADRRHRPCRGPGVRDLGFALRHLSRCWQSFPVRSGVEQVPVQWPLLWARAHPWYREALCRTKTPHWQQILWAAMVQHQNPTCPVPLQEQDSKWGSSPAPHRAAKILWYLCTSQRNLPSFVVENCTLLPFPSVSSLPHLVS